MIDDEQMKAIMWIVGLGLLTVLASSFLGLFLQ